MKDLIRFRNKKLAKDGIGDFKITAGKTCPFAGECKKYCYASTGTFKFPTVLNFCEETFEATKQDSFIERITAEIYKHTKKGMTVLRLHSSGDFYSQKYFDKWLAVAKSIPDVIFYAYTKSLPFIRWSELPKNFVIIQSEGGRLKVDKRRKHARVFPTEADALEAGYVVANGSDLIALKERKIGLVAHGALGGYVE